MCARHLFTLCMFAVSIYSGSINTFTPNECIPAKGCNVCQKCCSPYILDGPTCDACVKEQCASKSNECNPQKACNVCDKCCSPYILDGTACDSCVRDQCKAPSPCKHGGTLDLKTKACTNCAGAWGGVNCDLYNPQNITQAEILKRFGIAINSSQAQLDSQTSLNPLCKQGEECVGWGVDPISGSPAKFPIIKLTYNDSGKTTGGKREPEQTQNTPVLNKQFAFDTNLFPSINDFLNYAEVHNAGANPPSGTSGIYSQPKKDVLDKFFSGGESTPLQGLSVGTATMAVIDMTLPIDPNTKKYSYDLDDTFELALWNLPGPCIDTNSTKYGCGACNRWWTKECYAPLFTQFFANYGGGVVVQAQLGGRVEQYSVWDSHLAMTAEGKNQLGIDAQVDLAAATGLPGIAGKHDRNVTNHALVCVGGSSAACNKDGISPGASGTYADSLSTSHKLLHYQIQPLGEMLDYFDSEVKLAVEQAMRYYIQEKQQEWKEYYSKYLRCEAPFTRTSWAPAGPLWCPTCPGPGCPFYPRVNWSWVLKAEFGGNCRPGGGNVAVPVAGTGKGDVQVVACRDDGQYYNLHCHVAVTANTGAGAAAYSVSLTAHFNGPTTHPSGASVNESGGCSKITNDEKKPLAQCCLPPLNPPGPPPPAPAPGPGCNGVCTSWSCAACGSCDCTLYNACGVHHAPQCP